MPKKPAKTLTYAEVGVDRRLRTKSKKALETLGKTYRFSRYGPIVKLPYGNIFPIGGNMYLDLVIEEIGTKVLIAQLADKYDTIGIDGIAMAVNDVIRSGARPLALADNIHAHVSNPALIREWMKGIVGGAEEAECVVPSGEIGDVPDLIKGIAEGKGFDMVFASVGEVHKHSIIYGSNLKPGDVVIGMRSSGIHSNGISLARKVLFKHWGGAYEPFDVPDGLGRELVYEVLEPTRIYVKPMVRLAGSLEIKAMVHITGDAYLKFDKLMHINKCIGFEFDNFKSQPIFRLIQQVSEKRRKPISDHEMFKTFNMGWGFAVVVDRGAKDEAVDLLCRGGIETESIGTVTEMGKIVVKYEGKKMHLSRE
ncbi:MAG TPA: phosphoribosylformylglycinamidine cyclo-ligase [Candidatus Bathyarchaeia archaeon]|nr:phosphoribosylformylglycinamidine cyclo-ligase [Candidatus Bathyarchaeia archaeon]